MSRVSNVMALKFTEKASSDLGGSVRPTNDLAGLYLRDPRLVCRGYREAMRGVRDRMLMRTDKDGLLFVGELNIGHAVPKMDHLVCFLPGTPPCPVSDPNELQLSGLSKEQTKLAKAIAVTAHTLQIWMLPRSLLVGNPADRVVEHSGVPVPQISPPPPPLIRGLVPQISKPKDPQGGGHDHESRDQCP